MDGEFFLSHDATIRSIAFATVLGLRAAKALRPRPARRLPRTGRWANNLSLERS